MAGQSTSGGSLVVKVPREARNVRVGDVGSGEVSLVWDMPLELAKPTKVNGCGLGDIDLRGIDPDYCGDIMGDPTDGW